MRSKLLLILMAILVAMPVLAESPGKASMPKASQLLDTDNWIDINKILMLMSNDGVFGTDLGLTLGKTDGLYFPFTSVDDILSGANNTSVIYSSGIWLGAIDNANGDTLIAVAEYSEEYLPGLIDTITGLSDDTLLTTPEYRVYALEKDSTGAWITTSNDWINWPTSQGAPTDTVSGQPKTIGDQMLWTVFNDAWSGVHTNNAGSTAPLGVEAQLTTFGFKREDALGNVVFLRYKLMNKGGKDLRNMYVSLWADPDLGGASDDLVGCDTLLSLGYTYNATNKDNSYGSRPPAVGYDFFQGPLEFTGDDADTALMWNGQKFPQYRNLPMSSFNKYINGTDPNSKVETYSFMAGLDKTGSGMVPYEYPQNSGNIIPFQKSGDPVTGLGDVDNNPADRRMMLTTGPFDFAPGDSTEILAAIIVGQGSDRLTSVTALKYYDKFAQSAYDLNFELPEPPASPQVSVANLNGEITLSWNTLSEDNHGDFPFEGYTVFQGESPSGPWTRLVNYDLNNAVGIIFDEQFDLTDGVVVVKPVKFGSDGGIQRFYTTTEDAINGGALNNVTQYFYKVEAYSYDPASTPKTLTSAAFVTTTPQGPIAGETYQQGVGDVLTNVHIGASDGSVEPLVVDPSALTGDNYRVEFFMAVDTIVDTSATPDSLILTEVGEAWGVRNARTGELAVYRWFNQSGGNDYPVADGIMWRVLGPALNFKSFEMVQNAAGPIDPPVASAFHFQGFPTPGDLDPDISYQAIRDTTIDSSVTPPETLITGVRWGIHTADNGGTNDGGTRGTYTAFLSRTTRDGGNWPLIIPYDFEMRFTGSNDNPGVNGSYAFEAFGDGTVFWVPFELWNIGIATPDDPSDDFKLVPWILDDAGPNFEGDDKYGLESWGDSNNGEGDWEHSASGGNNDPYTDWVYWTSPDNETPGTAGYDAAEALMLGGTYAGDNEHEVMARTVLVSWNGGSAPPFLADHPEQGTVFRIVSTKPNQHADTFNVATQAPVLVTNEAGLQKIRAVPNPYYLFSSYDDNTYRRQLRFTNLPQKATINIYNIAGDLVATVQKDSPESWVSWNVETANGIPVASGIYIYVVEASGYGQYIGKMAIFTEKEQLNAY